ncbi:hypothetical protein J4433_00590 [Candidatus Pacearchaeota archaeon]|nr:hypothetical protein [Candidatus Pacearchaeota archaeon]
MGKNQILFYAAVSITLILAAALLNSSVSAQEAENSTITLPSAGVMPDSPFYGLEMALERIRLALTLNKAEKARLGLAYAEERLSELKLLVEAKKLKAAERAREEHQKLMLQVRDRIKEVEEENETREAEEKIKIEKKIRQQEIALDEVESGIKIKGNLTAEQQESLDKLIASFKNSTAGAKIQIKISIGKTELKIRQRTGKSEEEIKERIQKIRNETGSIEICETRNKMLIKNLEERIGAIEERLEAEMLSGINTTALQQTLEQLKEIKEKAEERLEEREEACDEAEKLAEDAKEIAGDAAELEEEGTERAAEAIAKILERMQEMKEAGVKGINKSNVITKLTAVRASLREKAEIKEQIEKTREKRAEINEKLQGLKEVKRERIEALRELKEAGETKASVRIKEQASEESGKEEEKGERTIQEAEKPTTQMSQETARTQSAY